MTDTLSKNISSANDTIVCSTVGIDFVSFQINGMWSGSFVFEGTVDGINWVGMYASSIVVPGAIDISTTSNGAWRILTGGLASFRLRAQSFSNGIASIFCQTNETTNGVRFTQNTSSASSLSSSWMVKLTDGNNVLGSFAHPLPVTGSFTGSSTGTTTTRNSSVSQITLLSANAARLGATIFNDSSNNLFVSLSSSVSQSNYTIKIRLQSYYETPFGYTGIIVGLWDVATGSARITEFT